MRVYVEGIGIKGVGFENWASTAAILTGQSDYAPSPVTITPTPLLPANERRRMVQTVKLSIQVGTEAFENAKRNPQDTATIFTSSGGDGETIHGILEALASTERDVSPTRFHNSVHNAPSGYWSIATKTHEPTTSLCIHDASFTGGLLEAAAQATVDDRAVGLISYDLPYPEPLHSVRPIGSTFAVSLILTPSPSEASFACLTISLEPPTPPTTMTDPRWEAIRVGNPSARSLPLLEALAKGAETTVSLENVAGNSVKIAVSRNVA